MPVDYQPDFDDYSLVPVDYDPFAADGPAQQAQIQQAQAQPQGPPQQQPATGAGQPDAGAPAAGGGPSGSEGGGIGPPTRLWIKAQPKLLPLAATLWCRWTISRISERSMRIEHNGQWTEVPKECLSVFAFGVDGLSLSGDDAGLGISLIEKPMDRDESVKVTIFKRRDKVLCFQVVPCPNVENPDHLIIECNRDLR